MKIRTTSLLFAMVLGLSLTACMPAAKSGGSSSSAGAASGTGAQAANTGTGMLLVSFAGSSSALSAQNGTVDANSYSERPGDASKQAPAREGNAMSFVYTLSKSAGSSYLGAGLTVGTPANTALDLSRFGAVRIRVASSVAKKLRIRVGGSDLTVQNSGCYPVSYINVSNKLETYTVALSAFAPESFCAPSTPNLTQTLGGVSYFEVADNELPSSGPVSGKITLESIEFVEKP